MNIDIKFLLVCLQLIIITLMSLAVEGVEGGSRHIGEVPGEFFAEEFLNSRAPMKSIARLYNRCSKAFVEVPSKSTKISATIKRANKTDEISKIDLELEAYREWPGTTKVRIRGIASGRYICFNQKGRLVTRPSKKAKGSGKFCEFKEEYGEDGLHTVFISKKNPDWRMGFNKNGSPIRFTDNNRRHAQCFDFLKIRLCKSSRGKHHPHRHHHGDPDCPQEDSGPFPLYRRPSSSS